MSMRRAGRVPELPVLVALAGPLRFDNVTLSAAAGQPYDWRPVAALDVEVFASADVPWSDLLRTLADIASVVPDTLVLAFREGPRVYCGERHVVTTTPARRISLISSARWLAIRGCTSTWSTTHARAKKRRSFRTSSTSRARAKSPTSSTTS